ncbi:isopeptide-forming domain-containing fimbrial protein [Rivularia sp. UHCC 0363]|uniref:isopeptide-forming domain-containing fimbrial protein n=1 Tax=Rivularia sp. UHCC 0363 TaxID=3110244 RepID=UPI002B20140D|nr:isopeptide-forming domain-containing fimbrial protein [Rivularia sp. UHCC 0363]MEA5597741.1 isopeptide-forming domain-containing fimbrial protein [Rivularia sp. UHCC 0363]
MTFKSKLIRSFILLFTTFSYQSLLLLVEANFSQVAAQTAPRLCAVPGKDGPVSNLNGVINTYYPGAADVNAGATSIPIGTPTGASTPIQPGDLLLVIQMQGADINSDNTNSYGDGVAGGSDDVLSNFTPPSPTGASGNLNNANFIAGNYEYVVATGAVGGGSVTIQGTGAGGGLINSYSNAPFGTQGQKTYQVIRIPQYSSATMSSGLTASSWNGSTGGILVYDVAGNLNLGGAAVDLSGRGFRGGGGRQLQGERSFPAPALNQVDYRSLSTFNTNGSKGEGTAGTPRFIFNSTNNSLLDNSFEGYPNGSLARGAPGNAGGGGTDGDPLGVFRFPNGENSGGGGGGNGGSGGLGGRTFSSNYYTGGFGGSVFPSTSNRLILGGGGGAGTTNDDNSRPLRNGLASSGAAGGGIAFVRTGSVSGSGTINADGVSAFDTRVDGAGGGGAGGTVVVSSANNNLTGLAVTANGGRGGNSLANEPHGPGGGGGGGVIFTSPGANVSANGGASGQTSNPLEPFGATRGTNGTTSNVGNINGASSGAECLPQLTITKTTSTPGPILKPGQATYTITVANAANLSTATNVNISDPLPSGFTFDGSTNPTITLNGGSVQTSTINPADGETVPNFGTFNIPSGGSVAVTFTTNINENVPNGEYNNPATATYLDPTRTTPDGTTSVNYDAATIGEEVIVGSPVPADPERLRGLKRITNVYRNGAPISGINFNSFIDDPNDPIDNLPGWFQLSPVGVFDISPQLPLEIGDEVEYTMYFLADGNRPVENVRFCDPIPNGTSFVPDTFGSGTGISVNLSNTVTSNTNNTDGDNGSFFASGTGLPANNFCPNQDNSNGAVIVNLGTINHTLGTNFGFIRFRVKVD